MDLAAAPRTVRPPSGRPGRADGAGADVDPVLGGRHDEQDLGRRRVVHPVQQASVMRSPRVSVSIAISSAPSARKTWQIEGRPDLKRDGLGRAAGRFGGRGFPLASAPKPGRHTDTSKRRRSGPPDTADSTRVTLPSGLQIDMRPGGSPPPRPIPGRSGRRPTVRAGRPRRRAAWPLAIRPRGPAPAWPRPRPGCRPARRSPARRAPGAASRSRSTIASKVGSGPAFAIA